MPMDWTVLDQAADRLRREPRAGEAVLRMLTFAWNLPNDALIGFVRPFPVSAAGFESEVSLWPAELVEGYLPTARLIHECPLGQTHRLLVGLAGIPGGGKSTVAAILDRIWHALRLNPPLCLLAMDGYHLPNAVLDDRSVMLPDGRIVPLRSRKGSPESFNLAAIVRDLRLLRYRNTVVDLPRYDRNLHEPVPAAVRAGSHDPIILCEGNYLLSTRHPWNEISRLFDLRLFLDCPARAARATLIERHQRGGSAPAEACRRIEQNDDLNTACVLETQGAADLVVTTDDHHHVLHAARACRET